MGGRPRVSLDGSLGGGVSGFGLVVAAGGGLTVAGRGLLSGIVILDYLVGDDEPVSRESLT